MTKTFPIGGIHPDKHKIAGDIAISSPGLPEIVYIPIKQHIGAPAKILVNKGDKVKVGSLLAAADGLFQIGVDPLGRPGPIPPGKIPVEGLGVVV